MNRIFDGSLTFLVSSMLMACAAVVPSGSVTPLPRDLAVERSRRAVATYAHGEYVVNSALMIAGAVEIGLGSYAISRGGDFSTALGATVVTIGAIRLGTGMPFLIYTAVKRAELDRWLSEDPARFAAEERARLAALVPTLPYYIVVEVVTALTGAGLWIAGSVNNDPTLEGVGVGLVGESGAQLIFDSTVLMVATRYQDEVHTLWPEVALTPRPDGAVGGLRWWW